MKTRKSNSGVQSGHRKRAGGKRSSEPAPKHPRRHPVEATEQQRSSRPLTTEDIPELVKAVVEAMPSQPASASETARSVAPPPGTEERHVHGRFNASAAAEQRRGATGYW